MFRELAKRLFISAALAGAVSQAGAAAAPAAPRDRCGIVQMTENFTRAHPEARGRMEAARLQLEKEASAMRASSTQPLAAPIVIPVVVHIIHSNGPENISDAKVIEGIEQVNQDFKMQNASPSLIHPNFRSLVTDTQMTFRLAKRDPNGQPTNGVTRTYNPTWSANGGADESNMKRTLGWPQHKYLNVYVVESAYGGSSSAYAHYPSSVQPPYEHYDGIIISAWAYGRTTPGYYTILSHEIGHWANLIHTWGEGSVGLSSNCSTDDLVRDTPNCAGDAGTRCNVNSQTCGYVDNNENFMDYGQCATMFTAGQVSRMHAAMNSSIGRRNEIWTQANLIATGVYEGTGNNLPPTANFNFSVNGLTVSFSDSSTDADGSIASRSWSFGDSTTSTQANPTKTYSAAGTYNVTLTVTDNQGASSSTSRSVSVGGTTPTPTLPECTGSDTRQLDRNCKRSNRSASSGDYDYLYMYLPSGVSQLKITTSGGTGDANVYASSGSWATTSSYQHASTNSGNSETLTISNPPSGYFYVSLHAASAFSGVTVTAEY